MLRSLLIRSLQLKFFSKIGSQCVRLTKPEGNNRSGEEFNVVIVPTAMHFKLIKPELLRKTRVERCCGNIVISNAKSKNLHMGNLRESTLIICILLPRLALLTPIARGYTSARHLIMKAKFSKDEKQSDVEPE